MVDNSNPKKVARIYQEAVILLMGLMAMLIGTGLLGTNLKFASPLGYSLFGAGLVGLIRSSYLILVDQGEGGENDGEEGADDEDNTQRDGNGDAMDVQRLAREFGFKNAYMKRGPRLREEVYEPKLNDASEAIDIMGFGLRKFRQDFGEYFAEWAYSMDVRILLLDPRFPGRLDRDEFDGGHTYAEQRDREEGKQTSSIGDEVEVFVNDYRHLYNDNDASFEIRLYQCLPSITVFRIDNEIHWGPYTVGKLSRDMPVFVISKGTDLYRFLQTHFNRIWKNDKLSTDPPEEWLE